jgi:hypothetical protein
MTIVEYSLTWNSSVVPRILVDLCCSCTYESSSTLRAAFEPHASWIFQLNFKLIKKKKSVFKIELSHSYNKTNFDDAKEAVRSRNVKKERQIQWPKKNTKRTKTKQNKAKQNKTKNNNNKKKINT